MQNVVDGHRCAAGIRVVGRLPQRFLEPLGTLRRTVVGAGGRGTVVGDRRPAFAAQGRDAQAACLQHQRRVVVECQRVDQMLQPDLRRAMRKRQVVGVIATGHHVVVDPDRVGAAALVDRRAGPPVRLVAFAARAATGLRRAQIEIVTSVGHLQSLVRAARASYAHAGPLSGARLAPRRICRAQPSNDMLAIERRQGVGCGRITTSRARIEPSHHTNASLVNYCSFLCCSGASGNAG